MDSILLSANPKLVTMSDVIGHLQTHEKVYFEVKFPIVKEQFSFPLNGFIHISGDKVRYVAAIEDILPFSKNHYANPRIAEAVKPARWLHEWRNNINNIRFDRWKHELVMTKVVPFEYNTNALEKYNGGLVAGPPQNYTKIKPPPDSPIFPTSNRANQDKKLLVESNAIDAVIKYYEKVGYSIKSVEKENIGYDLEASKRDNEEITLHIEVKGSSLPDEKDISVGLTPNEYKTSKRESNNYRICIVSDALDNPNVHEFKWNSRSGFWEKVNKNLRLEVEERISANMRIVRPTMIRTRWPEGHQR